MVVNNWVYLDISVYILYIFIYTAYTHLYYLSQTYSYYLRQTYSYYLRQTHLYYLGQTHLYYYMERSAYYIVNAMRGYNPYEMKWNVKEKEIEIERIPAYPPERAQVNSNGGRWC